MLLLWILVYVEQNIIFKYVYHKINFLEAVTDYDDEKYTKKDPPPLPIWYNMTTISEYLF